MSVVAPVVPPLQTSAPSQQGGGSHSGLFYILVLVFLAVVGVVVYFVVTNGTVGSRSTEAATTSTSAADGLQGSAVVADKDPDVSKLLAAHNTLASQVVALNAALTTLAANEKNILAKIDLLNAGMWGGSKTPPADANLANVEGAFLAIYKPISGLQVSAKDVQNRLLVQERRTKHIDSDANALTNTTHFLGPIAVHGNEISFGPRWVGDVAPANDTEEKDAVAYNLGASAAPVATKLKSVVKALRWEPAAAAVTARGMLTVGEGGSFCTTTFDSRLTTSNLVTILGNPKVNGGLRLATDANFPAGAAPNFARLYSAGNFSTNVGYMPVSLMGHVFTA